MDKLFSAAEIKLFIKKSEELEPDRIHVYHLRGIDIYIHKKIFRIFTGNRKYKLTLEEIKKY